MKNFLLLFATFLTGCTSVDIVECEHCEKAPTSILIPNAHNTMKANRNIERELILPFKEQEGVKAAEKKVVITPVAESPKSIDNKISKLNTTNIQELNEKKIPALLASLSQEAKKKWGNEGYLRPSKHRYVKYFDDYTTRSEMQFDKGKIIVSTISTNEPKAKLKNAIVQTILMPALPAKVDLFGTKEIDIENNNGSLLFLGQILDQENKSMEWRWRASRYADYLIENKLKQKTYAKGMATYVEMTLVNDHLALREQRYSQKIKSIASKYALPESLLSAVIKTESSFNPFAMTHEGSLGLMQIMPSTAGADVFRLVKKINTQPSADYLFIPENNIEIGAAYLNLLYNTYFGELTNSESRYFAMISAYNGGTNRVFSTFDLDKGTAIEKINQSQANQVYEILTTEHPKEEARAYLQKVISFQKTLS